MRNKVLLLLLTVSLFSCNNPSSNSELISSEEVSFVEESSSIGSSEEVELSELDLVKKIKSELEAFTSVVSSCTYNIEQVDYYGISIEVSETGTKTLYNDNFLKVDFSQKIGGETIEGKREYGLSGGLISGYKIYEISYYGEEDSENKVSYYDDFENNRKLVFDIGFVNEYVSNILNTTIAYYEYDDSKLSLTTNFDQVDLSTDGTKLLQYRFIKFASNGIHKIEEVQRDDTIVIENGKIVSCSTEMLYSLQDGVNYQYMNKEVNFFYEELSSYEEIKLNPKDFE